MRLRADRTMTGHHFRKGWGAEPEEDGQWRFSLWSPDREAVAVEIDGVSTALAQGEDGWFSGTAAARPGASYGFRIGDRLYPDPAARAQMGDVHGPSRLVDPRAFQWSADWAGLPWHQAVIYELHLGTFTPEGTFAAAQRALPRLKSLGVTVVELMPVAQFEGTHGWGYDGVLLYAPHPCYGGADGLKQFVDAAHKLGIAVMLDVVYNHFGPSGNYLPVWCPSFFHASARTPWGDGIAFDVPAVRAFFLDNALFWLEEYQLDGLRLDAVHAIADQTTEDFLADLGKAVRARDWGRPIHLVTEDERNLVDYLEPDAPFNASWNDDWHHAIHCLLTGEDESYYAPFAVDPLADIEMALRDGYVEQGQKRPPHEHLRGEPSALLPRTAFINFLGNHDQVGNRAQGERLHHLVADRAALRVVTALTLLTPFTPMLFMGDEFLTEAPFLFFTDFTGDLAEAVRTGRAREFEKFTSFAGTVPDPNDPQTAARSMIGHAATDAQREHEAFVRDLLALRAFHITPLLAQTERPKAAVTREGAAFDARWEFETAALHVRLLLGGEDFSTPTDPFFVEAAQGSGFAFAAAVRKDQ
ncbi:malto-oligosyltrehalose trehalohydrolase [Sphingobium sp. B12D2B]|uniref:malto-oligosyltrehalose trehalohydrolase n=1 Tax=Sphingobium sp. B12D2B TaxID=2940577 RepID=UPI00222495D5|nr:malto-oligosyltrehalose trehalohydrolase [Sphingobium sp. B12D2B]MCW2351627.1 malto-oligosyltrehalose trehalohydrolase [Sphingobium sp. B12D2B]